MCPLGRSMSPFVPLFPRRVLLPSQALAQDGLGGCAPPVTAVGQYL